MKVIGDTKCKITKDKNSENIPNLEINVVVLVHCNISSNNYKNLQNNNIQKSKALYTFFPNKLFGQLLNFSPKKVYFLKTFDSELLYIKVRFIEQNYTQLAIEDKINITLVIN